MNEGYRQLQPYLDKSYALTAACTLFNWDNSTLAPKKAIENTAKAIGILSGELYHTLVHPEVKRLLTELSSQEGQQTLSFQEKAVVRTLNKEIQRMEAISPEEYEAYNMLLARASSIWEKAKMEDDYASFAPVLEEIIGYQKKFASRRQKEGQTLYDVVLDEYEEGFDTEILDDFFTKLRTVLVPLVQKISQKNEAIATDFLRQPYDLDTQKTFCHFLAEYVGFDFERGAMAESQHPFTTGLHNCDVRITDHYQECRPDSAIFCAIHESGHALYEMDIDDDITMTPVGSGVSMGMHESQSRFYENNLGRSREFWEPIYGKLQEAFPKQLGEIPLEQFYRAINRSMPSLIRTEADELTYPFHIMIRYEIEKMIFEDKVTAAELPALWNQKYKEYLGITPENDAQGILQDVHWSGGGFGYFPSYALGSAIAAQLFHHMETQMPLKEYLRQGNLQPIQEYLRVHIHRFGKCKTTQELLQDATGEGFNPDYYIAYLVEKYRQLYDLMD